VAGPPRPPALKEPLAPPDVGVGSRLGKYEIIKRLATGGMAEIFLARVSGLPGFQKMVVIKRILPQLATKTDFVEMFLDEARIAATLQHPNVVQMYDVGVVDGNYFIAMEYLHGEDVRSLSRILHRQDKKLPLEHALNVVIGVSSGLHYAHEKVGFDGKPLEIVHRDVTPQNIIVTYDGAVKLLDFGIAKASNRFGETRFGTLKGKVPYMSPEQCRGEPLDRRSDIFSLGIMLYELTLGKRLYQGKSDFEVLKQIVEGTVTPPSELDKEYPKALEEIVMRALEKEKDKRYQTARDIQADLESMVRADRLHVSPIALTRFMEETFGNKIEAWREAQAKGVTLGEHLEKQPVVEVKLEDDDLEELGETQAREAERIAAERAAFRQKIERAHSGAHDVVPANLDAVTRALQPPPREPEEEAPRLKRGPPWMVIGTAALVAAIGVAVVLHSRSTRQAAATTPAQVTAVAPVTTPVTTPLEAAQKPEPTTPEPAKAEAAKAEEAKAETAPAAAGKAAAHHPHKTKHAAAVATPAPSEPAMPKMPAGPKPAPLAAIQSPDAKKEQAPVKLEGEGTLLLASSPWCNVKIDGVDKGPTPISVKLPAGKHTVVLTNPEFKINRSLPVMIMPNETNRKRFDF
jgi:tRNA A-37 threonylcarbamoyl transferase component Bud32